MKKHIKAPKEKEMPKKKTKMHSMKHSKEDLREAAKHMKAHGG